MNRKFIYFMAILFLSGAMTFSSCKKEEMEDNDGDITEAPFDLYNRLGGTDMVMDPANPGMIIEQGRLTLRSVVDSTIFVIAADADFLTKFFPVLVAELGVENTTGLNDLSKSLTDFFCVATGSKNDTYTGIDMKTAHDPALNPRMGARSSNEDFDKFVGFVVAGAEQNGVPPTDPIVADIGRLLETLRGAIVQ
jgi:hypothetical protein